MVDFDPLESEQRRNSIVVHWVHLDGSLSSGEMTDPVECLSDVNKVIQGEEHDVNKLSFRDPSTFKSGELGHHLDMWEEILTNYQRKEDVLEWLRDGVDVMKFMKPFKGKYMGVLYDAAEPPSKRFKNHSSCKYFEHFVTTSILERIRSGAIRVWGKVGEVAPPHLILPLTVEPNKPRLCIDARFLNLWMADTPFTLETLKGIPSFVHENAYLSKIDDKSGYDHVLLSSESQTYFGIEWQGWWLVGVTLPFGWKNSPYIYQTVGLGPTHFFRGLGITCSLYIDDRLNGEILRLEGTWSRPLCERTPEYSFQSARAALYIICKVLVNIGYFLGLSKCVLHPVNRIQYLGMLIDSPAQAFGIPQDKRQRFAQLREEILKVKSCVPLKSIQKLMGKCISFSLAFPGAKFYIREMASAVGKASHGGDVILSEGLREEISFWRFLDNWDETIPWRSERHTAISLSSDSSSFRWAAVLHHASQRLEIGDYWEPDMREEHINVKEMSAVLKTLKSLPEDVHDCRIDAQVDSLVVYHSWSGRGSRSKKLTFIAQEIFQCLVDKNLSLEMSYVPSGMNAADWFSRKLSKADAMLSPASWEIIECAFGGEYGHNFDLMSLDSNVQRDRNGEPLPHYTPYPTPESAGVNVFNQDLSGCDGITINAYVFPPFNLIAPLLRFLSSQSAIATLVVPVMSPLPTWWPLLNTMAKQRLLVASKGSPGTLLFPTKQGFRLGSAPYDLWAMRIGSK